MKPYDNYERILTPNYRIKRWCALARVKSCRLSYAADVEISIVDIAIESQYTFTLTAWMYCYSII